MIQATKARHSLGCCESALVCVACACWLLGDDMTLLSGNVGGNITLEGGRGKGEGAQPKSKARRASERDRERENDVACRYQTPVQSAYRMRHAAWF